MELWNTTPLLALKCSDKAEGHGSSPDFRQEAVGTQEGECRATAPASWGGCPKGASRTRRYWLALTVKRLHDMGLSGLHTIWIVGLGIVANGTGLNGLLFNIVAFCAILWCFIVPG